MTGEPNDGGSAFPSLETETYRGEPGMSLRDYFAGQAIAGMLANSSFDDTVSYRYDSVRGNAGGMTRAAWCVADAMLAAREEVKSDA